MHHLPQTVADMNPSIIYQNSTRSITILDIPRSIELAQGPYIGKAISLAPLERPYPSLEPKTDKAKAKFGGKLVGDLLIERWLEIVLGEVKREESWCLERAVGIEEDEREEAILDPPSQEETHVVNQSLRPSSQNSIKKKAKIYREDNESITDEAHFDYIPPLDDSNPTHVLYNNPNTSPALINVFTGLNKYYIPPKATVLQGDIFQTMPLFTSSAPTFNLIVMDPPWPNRSARRKAAYTLSETHHEISNLLFALPIPTHLEDNGLVAVWITNKPSFREMILGPKGLFHEWGVQLIEEWIWLKVTIKGEPIYPIDSVWRKPYELLLIGRKGTDLDHGEVGRKVILGVPDLHSRKPNLKHLLEDLIHKQGPEYSALEIFARNLTAGWWSWGNEALKFQSSDHWLP